MNFRRIMIAAPKSGSGKTTIACALLKALKDKGESVSAYKCGPDYIDPLFHEKAIGVPSKNLDTFFTDSGQTLELFVNGISDYENDIAVIEGVMGIFDGLGGAREEGSSYHLAKITKTPIVLIVDAKGMGRSVVAMIAGFLAYDSEKLIRGAILNRVSKGHYETIKPLIEDELKLPVLGFMAESEDVYIKSRHLGLVMPRELENIKEKLKALSEEFCKTVSMEAVLKIADGAGELSISEKMHNACAKKLDEKEKPVICVAKDEAFCFYYADNIRLLEEYGAAIKYFSPLHDEKLPDKCHALLIGGGYPELYAEELCANKSMRMSIKAAAECGMPIVAECGGFMYLHSAIIDKEGRREMAGVVDGECFYTGKLVRFGYIELCERRNFFLLEGECIKGHEFHYYDSSCNGTDVCATKPVTGKQYSCIIEGKNCWMGFPHLYYPSNPAFARAFVEKACAFSR